MPSKPMTKTGKHTPGPWVIDRGSNPELTVYYIVGATASLRPNRNRVARLWKNTRATDEANALLISKAPELVEALRELHETAANLENDDDRIPDHAWEPLQASIDRAASLLAELDKEGQ